MISLKEEGAVGPIQVKSLVLSMREDACRAVDAGMRRADPRGNTSFFLFIWWTVDTNIEKGTNRELDTYVGRYEEQPGSSIPSELRNWRDVRSLIMHAIEKQPKLSKDIHTNIHWYVTYGPSAPTNKAR